MHYLLNNTPFASKLFIYRDRQGIEMMCVAVKATYDIKADIRIANEQRPIIIEDVFWGEPGESSLKYPAEVTPEKPGTDVVLIGEACAPIQGEVTEMFVGFSVAGRKRILKVSGDRYWKKGLLSIKPSEPEPFERMPIVYERAYGGMHIMDVTKGKILSVPINPIGKGFRGKRGDSEQELGEIGVPNIEDPDCLLKSPSNKAKPVGYGAIAPKWQPRAAYFGSYDGEWRDKRLPFLPDDFDSRFYQAAHPELIFPNRLRGGEPFIINGMSPSGKKVFNLPADEPQIEMNIEGRFLPEKSWISTVLLEPTDERISIVRLAAAGYGRNIKSAQARVNL